TLAARPLTLAARPLTSPRPAPSDPGPRPLTPARARPPRPARAPAHLGPRPPPGGHLYFDRQSLTSFGRRIQGISPAKRRGTKEKSRRSRGARPVSGEGKDAR